MAILMVAFRIDDGSIVAWARQVLVQLVGRRPRRDAPRCGGPSRHRRRRPRRSRPPCDPGNAAEAIDGTFGESRNLGAIRVYRDYQDWAGTTGRFRILAGELVVAALPMASLLGFGLLVGFRDLGRRPFVLRFEAFGGATLALYIALCFLFPEELRDRYLSLILQPVHDRIGPAFGPDALLVLYAVAGAMLLLPQATVALVGGMLVRELGQPRARQPRLPARRGSQAMSDAPPWHESCARLRRAGWSMGDSAFAGPDGPAWPVSGHNDERGARLLTSPPRSPPDATSCRTTAPTGHRAEASRTSLCRRSFASSSFPCPSVPRGRSRGRPTRPS